MRNESVDKYLFFSIFFFLLFWFFFVTKSFFLSPDGKGQKKKVTKLNWISTFRVGYGLLLIKGLGKILIRKNALINLITIITINIWHLNITLSNAGIRSRSCPIASIIYSLTKNVRKPGLPLQSHAYGHCGRYARLHFYN